jgi:hypothetical protein
MFQSDGNDRPLAHRYAMRMTGLFTPTSLFLSLLPAKGRASVADPTCDRMLGWTIAVVRSFL